MPPRVAAWTTLIPAPWPHVSKPHAPGLARGSLGLGRARAWAVPAVRAFRAPGLGRTAPAVSPQWRAFGSEATAKRGTARHAVVVETC